MESDISEWQLNRYWYAEFCQKSILNYENAFISQHLCHIFILGMNGDNTDSQKLNKIISEIQALQEVVARFRQLRLDATEFACLKCIVTFKAGKRAQTPVSSSPVLPPDWLGPLQVQAYRCKKKWPLSPLQRGRFPPAFPGLPVTAVWSSFLVPTHSGSELRSFRNAAAIAALQDEAQLTLNSYIHTRWLLFALTVSFRKVLPLSLCEQRVISQLKHCH